ncbi:MAG: peptide chain release factor N(5)-glutamine methyltransferase, partial [Clostridiaceae bacterium]
RSDMENLQKEVTFEPRLALFGGEDGLDFYRRIAAEYRAHLNPGGTLLIEIGSTQAESVSALFGGNTILLNDLGGNPRVLIAEY